MRIKMRNRRKELNLSQQQLADLTGINRTNYSSIERGRTEPNLDQMILIAKVLKVKPEANFFKDFCDETYQKEQEVS